VDGVGDDASTAGLKEPAGGFVVAAVGALVSKPALVSKLSSSTRTSSTKRALSVPSTRSIATAPSGAMNSVDRYA
jgi:hypothetical protein